MSIERIERLEERLAWLERHVTEQDKAMLELVEQNDALRRDLELLRMRAGGDGGIAAPNDERPPHY